MSSAVCGEGEGRRIRVTEEETGGVEEMNQQKKKGKEHQTEDDVIQEVLRENSLRPQEPSPCCVSIYHILEGVCTKNQKITTFVGLIS